MNIVITGASRGIGFSTAELLAADPSNHVFALARSSEGLSLLADKCAEKPNPGVIRTFPFDLVNGNLRGELLLEIMSFLGQVDVLINNAGILVNKPAGLMEPGDFDAVFNANVKGPYFLIQALLPYFSQGSHIVNIGSMGGVQGSAKFNGLSLYSASKGALAILTECLAQEFAERKISVNCLAIGSAQTEMLSAAFPGYKAPLSARELAEFIAEFVAKGHRWFNGKVIPVALSTP